MSTTAAAASLMLEALPAVNLPAAAHTRLRRGDDGLEPAAAQAVERQRRGLDRQPALDAGHAGQVVVVGVGVDDVAEDDVADVPRLDAGPADGLANAQRRQ